MFRNRSFTRGLLGTLVLAGLVAETAHSQQAPSLPAAPPTPQFDELRPPPSPPRTDPSALPGGLPNTLPRELAKPSEDVRIDVRAFEILGGPPGLDQKLAPLLARYTGPGRSYENLADAAEEVTRYLQRDLGLYLGFAYIPEQKPKDGVVRLTIVEGRLDQVLLNWSDDVPVARSVVEAYLGKLTPGAVLTVRDVERVVFLVNDLRGVSARFELQEGREWGTASIVVTVKADQRWSRRVDADLDGSRYSGVGRLGAQAVWNSPGGRGDGLTLSALVSHTGGLSFGLIGYTTPVGTDGLKLGASVSAFHYRFDRDLLPLGLNGDAVSVSAYGLYPFVRARNLNLFGVVSVEHKFFDDRESATDTKVRKQTTELRAGITGDFRDNLATGGVSTYDLNATAGHVRFEDGRSPFNDDNENFAKIGLGYTRLQNLITNRLLLYVAYRGQIGLRNLDSSQQFRLGGADGVRAFAQGERNGDSGHLLTTELRWLPPDSWFGKVSRELVFAAFYDYGRVRLRHDPTTQRDRNPLFDNHATLAGRGVSVAWERPRDFSMRLHLSEPSVGRATSDTAVRRPRVYFEFSKQF